MSTEPNGPKPGLDAVEEYRRLLSGLPSGLAGTVELLAGQLSDGAEMLLRRGAIPHSIDGEVAAVLAPEIPPAEHDEIANELRELSFVITTRDGVMLHDEVRDYLFGQWLAAREADPGKWRVFEAVSARLAEYYDGLRANSVGEAAEVVERQRIFHLIGADVERGFDEFQKLCRVHRHNLRLGACEALIHLVREYVPVLSERQRGWLDYHDAKLLLDLRRHDQAKDLLESLVAASAAMGDDRLRTRSLYRLAIVLRELRDFERAHATFRELISVTDAEQWAVDLKIRAMNGFASLLFEMDRADEAEKILDDSLSWAQQSGDRSLLALCRNTMGILHRRFGRTQRALEAFREALRELEQGGETFRAGQAYNNIGLLHADRAEWAEAQQSLEKALDIARNAGDATLEAKALSNLGRVYLGQGKKNQAVGAAEKAIQIFAEIHLWFGAATTSRALARFYRREGRVSEARAAFYRARELFLRANMPKEAEACAREAERVGSEERAWGWFKWTLVVLGGVVAVVLLTFVLVLILEA